MATGRILKEQRRRSSVFDPNVFRRQATKNVEKFSWFRVLAACYQKNCLDRCCCVKIIIPWYTSVPNGSIGMVASIVNLISIGLITKYEAENTAESEKSIQTLVQTQIIVNYFYLFDLIVCYFVWGPIKTITSVGYLVETCYQIAFAIKIQQITKLILDYDSISADSRSEMMDFIRTCIVMRLLRVMYFLQELTQWDFFTRAIDVMKGPVFNFAFAVYSVLMIYTIIGM